VSYSADTHTNPNISVNSKTFSGVNQGPIWGRLLKKEKKNRGRQSRATVPLITTTIKKNVAEITDAHHWFMGPEPNLKGKEMIILNNLTPK
jgi:hypothetical protein